MFRRVSLAFLPAVLGLLLLGGLLRGQASGERSLAATPYRAGAVLAGFRAGVNQPAQEKILAAHGLTARNAIGPLHVVSLAVIPGQEAATIAALRRLPEVEFAELDYLAQAAELPDDPAWGRQWSLAQIGLPAAWNVTTGTSDIVIAVVDSGMKLDHPDLAPKLWVNSGEIPGNGLDDDGNGKVDDVNGWHFYEQWTPGGYIPAEDAVVIDEFGHGTHVAGIAAAATDNGIGIAGISWGARVMPVRVLDQYGVGWYSDIAAGIVYAADNGAQIINLSLGGAASSSALCAAAAYAYQKGVLLVAATGNEGGPVYYPAACRGVLAVAATDKTDAWADFSGYGEQVAVAAPGVGIYSTWPWLDGYFTVSGTSMAAPHVSGVAALVWSHWPDWSNMEVSRRITETAMDVDSPGWDPRTDWGRLDAAAALGIPPLRRVYLPLAVRP